MAMFVRNHAAVSRRGVRGGNDHDSIQPKDHIAPLHSWWVGLSREQLQAQILENLPRMRQSKEGIAQMRMIVPEWPLLGKVHRRDLEDEAA